jgi:hypothetical protein
MYQNGKPVYDDDIINASESTQLRNCKLTANMLRNMDYVDKLHGTFMVIPFMHIDTFMLHMMYSSYYK